MSNVLGEKAVASQMKSIANAGTAKMMGSTMGEMGMGSMMSGGMGPMMKTPGITAGIATGIVASARKSAINKVFTHPLILFGLGFVAGCYVYKYRKSIISASDEA